MSELALPMAGNGLRLRLAPLTVGIGRLWAPVQAYLEHRRAMAELYELDDRTLRDIGLHRSEIPFVPYREFGRGHQWR